MVVVEPGGIKTEWGGIAVQSLLDRSGASAYATAAKRWSQFLRNGDRAGSEPSVITDAIVRAVSVRNPHPRYVAGAFAVPILTARRFLSDRAFDSVMLFLGRTAPWSEHDAADRRAPAHR